MAAAKPIPIIVAGRKEAIGQLVIDVLKPEYEGLFPSFFSFFFLFSFLWRLDSSSSTQQPIAVLDHCYFINPPRLSAVIHFTLADAAATEIPLLLRGQVPNPSSSALGTGNWTTPPVAALFGGAFGDADIELLRKRVADAGVDVGGAMRRIPWVRVDSRKPAPPIGPEYARAVALRMKEGLDKLHAEGKLSEEGDGDQGVDSEYLF
jgi:hypothetical protein